MLNQITIDLLKNCYKCDCEHYPYCHILGNICNECFDTDHLTHKTPMPKAPGEFRHIRHRPTKCGTKDVSKDVSKDVDVKCSFRVIDTDPSGDCLYQAISLALDGKISIQDLRNLVASRQTEDSFAVYKMLADEEESGEFSVIEHANSLEEFRTIIKRCGSDYGSNNCLWGDENSLYHISNELQLIFVIFSTKGKFLQKIQPEKLPCRKHYIVLQMDQNKGVEHFNLLEFADHAILTESMWNYVLELLNQKFEEK